MKKKILSLLIALMISVPAFASIAVSPTRLEINANKARTNYASASINVTGDTTKAMRFKVYPGYFTVDDKSEVVMNDKSTDVQNISKKIRFVPSEFVVQPGKTQKLRVNVANLSSLPDGESRAMLYIEDVNPREYMLPTPQGVGAQLLVKTRIAVPVYVDKGKVSKIGEVEYFNLSKEKDGIYANMKVLSKGNSRVRYSTLIQVVKGKKLIKEMNLAEKVAPGGGFNVRKEKLDLSAIKEAGEYTVRAVVSYFDENGKRKTIKQETILNIQGEM